MASPVAGVKYRGPARAVIGVSVRPTAIEEEETRVFVSHTYLYVDRRASDYVDGSSHILQHAVGIAVTVRHEVSNHGLVSGWVISNRYIVDLVKDKRISIGVVQTYADEAICEDADGAFIQCVSAANFIGPIKSIP